MSPPSSNGSSSSPLDVQEVSQNRYHLVYAEASQAAHDAELWGTGQGILVPAALTAGNNRSLLCDVSVQDHPFKVTFYCNLISRLEERSVVEWVSRRRTDADLLRLWKDTLKDMMDSDDSADSADLAERVKLFNLCRRVLSDNPFIALDINTDASADEITDHYNDALQAIDQMEERVDSGTRAHRHIAHARLFLNQAYQALETEEGRQWARERYA